MLTPYLAFLSVGNILLEILHNTGALEVALNLVDKIQISCEGRLSDLMHRDPKVGWVITNLESCYICAKFSTLVL